MKPRAVFDCMVLLQGAARPRGPAAACLRLVDEEQVALCVSGDVLAEVRDVLTRPEVLKRFPGLSPQWVASFVENIEWKASRFADVPRVIPLERDPKDEPYLNLAIAAGARYLVSRDRDLLDLMNDEAFRHRFPALTILTPPAFLSEMARLNEKDASEGKG